MSKQTAKFDLLPKETRETLLRVLFPVPPVDLPGGGRSYPVLKDYDGASKQLAAMTAVDFKALVSRVAAEHRSYIKPSRNKWLKMANALYLGVANTLENLF